MNGLDDLLRRIPLDQLAARSGASRDEVESAVRAALPALVGGLQANAADPAGEASLAEALDQHQGMGEGVVDIEAVDPGDGEKITRHVFGDQTDAVVSQLGSTGADSGLVKKLLPLLAPIVLSYVAKRMGGGAKGGLAAGGLGAILSQVLSGAAGGVAGGSGKGGVDAGSIISDVLGGLLGGGRR